MQIMKCVVVGDGAVGKTCLLITYASNQLSSRFVPTNFNNYAVTVIIGDIFDIPGNDEYKRLRPLSYPKTDVLLVCFSVVNPVSCENIREKWIPEITYHCPRTPFLIVGTQIDLRDDIGYVERLQNSHQHPILPEQGQKLAADLLAAKYVECSALTQKGLKNVFEEAIFAALQSPRRKKRRSKCSVA